MTRVFLSFPHSELQTARRLARAVSNAGIEPVLDAYPSKDSEEILSHLLFSAASSDFVVLLMPTESRVAARWRQKGFSERIRSKLKSRNISIIPVYVGRRLFSLPSGDAVSFTLERGYGGEPVSESSIDRLSSYLSNLPRVNFDRLSPSAFEALIAATLCGTAVRP